MAGTDIASPGGPIAGPAASSGSSFHTALRILPPSQRQAMFEIYAFCRAVDDIADDGDAPEQARLDALAQWRADLAACYAGTPPARLRALDVQIRAFRLKQQDFLDVIDGMTMDVVADIQAPRAETLDLYCDRVASAVGRLAVRVFGLEEAPGIELSYHLGRALQLTNILRDIDEDAAINRLYLPAEGLAAAGIPRGTPNEVIDHPNIDRVCIALAHEAQTHYDASAAIMARCPSRLVKSPRIMFDVYHGILTRLLARGWRPPRARVRVPKARLVWILLRHTLF
ncbi:MULTISPECIES: presqualene diphosphate synthase HpnD [Cupriavidus]|uniref:Presqualene diphosphate synthase HpnD n=1 Tax=Cupriavidus pauculus TaxID=82633 RepID=A0A5P2HFH1_9BURK|nr:presqualene diphosphate synthase HpnD [Cupriavidus pauculus]QET05995.1 presqualene diphosphate synthase HpnD [Cupriavidus pauculus]